VTNSQPGSICGFRSGLPSVYRYLWFTNYTVCNQQQWSTATKHCRGGLHLKCDGTRAETRFRLSAKRTSPFKSAGASVQSTAGSRGVCISDSNAGYTMFRGSVKGTVYPLHSPVSPSLPLPCVTVCHHISTGLHLTIDGHQASESLGMFTIVFTTDPHWFLSSARRIHSTPCDSSSTSRPILKVFSHIQLGFPIRTSHAFQFTPKPHAPPKSFPMSPRGEYYKSWKPHIIYFFFTV
jgi:hypothetical protein